SLHLNFTDNAHTYGHSWNNIAFTSGNNTAYDHLINGAGKSTGIGLTVPDAWSGMQMDGANTYNNSGFVPDSVMTTGFYIDNASSRSLRLTGLDKDRKYNLVFFATSNKGGNTDYTTTYTTDGQTVS